MDVMLSQDFFDNAINFLTNNGLQTGFAFATGALSTIALRRLKVAQAKRNIHKGLVGFDRILVQEVRFDPSGFRNPESGNEFYDMKIRTITDHQEVGELFSPGIEGAMLEYLNKAIKHCTPEEPIVFQHLDKVLPQDPEKREAVLQNLEGEWINRFSTVLLARTNTGREFGLLNREVPEEVDVPVLLTYNPEAQRKQLRIFIFPKSQKIPAKADVRFKLDDEFEKASEQLAIPEWQKYNLFASIHEALEHGDTWESWRYSVSVPTGRTKAVAPPQQEPANDSQEVDVLEAAMV